MILSKPIVLVGMMGCGKSTIGKIVAEILNCFFLDSDREIENKMKLSTKEIFDKYGEKFFRTKEYEIFKFYSKKKENFNLLRWRFILSKNHLRDYKRIFL